MSLACSTPNEDFEDINPLLGSVCTSTDNRYGMQDGDSTEKTPDPKSNPNLGDDAGGDIALYENAEKVTLKRTLGLPGAVGIGLGIIVGSGIFISPEGVAENSGSVGAAMLIWVVCGLFSTIGALCFAELGITIPQSGGDYIYILQIFGSVCAFMRLWIEVIVIRPSAHAIIALTMAFYILQPLFPAGQHPPTLAVQLLAISCVGFLGWMNCVSIKWATRMQTLFTAAKVAALLLIVIIGVVQICNGHVENFRSDVVFLGSNLDPGKICMALYSGLWAFSGWNELNYVVDEIKNPARYLPLSIILSISTATVLYIAVNIAYFTVLSIDQMLANEATAVIFGKITLGKYSFVISLCVALSCFGGINGSLFTGSRLFYIGACQGHLPPILAMISTRSTAPVPTIMLISILTAVYMTTDDVFALINYSNFVYFFAMGVAILGLIIIRLKNPSDKKSFQMPLVFPVIAVIGCLVTGFLSFLQAPIASGIGVVVVLTSLPVYLLFVELEKPRFLTAIFDKITIILQCVTLAIPEEH